MKFNRIVLVSILLIIFAIGAVSATDDNMTDTADEVLSAEPTEDLEVSQPEDFSELVGLIKNTSSGKTLTLEKDYINDGTYTKGILISKKMTIDGQGHTLDANSKSNIFRISNSQVTLKNINFINSYSKDYSAVYGNCTVINCTFTDCICEKNGGALYNGTAYDSSFIRCEAALEDDHGHYANYGKGGAIYQGNAYNCSFVACFSSYFYGYWTSDEWSATGYGGAIYQGNAYNCDFKQCSSVDGGAIYNGNAYNSSFEECSGISIGWGVGFGGAINKGDAYDCSFRDCNAYCGGAIYQGNAHNSSFTGCWAYDGPSIEGSGGAIGIGNAYNSSFVDCFAYEGCAIYRGDAYNCYFIECSPATKKGAIINRGNAYDSTFINCTVKKGGIYVTGNMTNCIFLPFTFACSNLTVNYGEGGKLPISTVEGVNGVAVNVGIYKDNKLINSFSSTTGSDLIIDATPGTYIIALTCEYAKPQNVTVVVNKGSPKMALSNNYVKSGETANIKVSISKKATGFVRITIDGVTYRQQIISGIASVDVPNLADGDYTVTATYNGNVFHTAETMTDTFHVGKFTQGMELVTKNIKVGETERLTANLAKDTTGFVRFIIGEKIYRVVIENGVAYANVKDLKAGTYSVELKYGGNYKYNAETVSKTFTVSKSSPAITITTTNFNFDETGIINVNLAEDAPGNVLITVKGESQRIKIVNGVATLSIPILKAEYEISAKYAGNYKYSAETVTETFTLSKLSPIQLITVPVRDGNLYVKVGSDGNITVKLADDVPGNVLITVNGESQRVKIVNGEATLRLYNLKAGTHQVSVKYAGNYKYKEETKTASFVVDRFTATMTVSAKAENGKTIITVKTKTDMTGNLKITYEGNTYTAEIINGEATVNVDGIKSGTHSVSIKYDGNERYRPNTITRTITL